jgi:hypothetical protein
MSNLFDSQVQIQESNWFQSLTSNFDDTNKVKYRLPITEVERLKNKFFQNKSSLMRTSSFHNDAYTLEVLLRKCFKKCNQFVLEDWIDNEELSCTLKCANLQKEAYEILKNKSF